MGAASVGLKKQMASASLMALASTLLTAYSYRIYIGYLGIESLGVWTMLALLLQFTSISSFGCGPALVSLTGECSTGGDFHRLSKLVSNAVLLSVALFVPPFVWLSLYSESLVQFMGLALPLQTITLVPLLTLIGLQAAINDLLFSVVSGMGGYHWTTLSNLLSQAISVAVSSYLLAKGAGLIALAWGSAAAIFLSTASALLLLVHFGQSRIRVAGWDSACCRELLSVGVPLFGSSLLSLIFLPGCKVVLTRAAGPGATAIFDIALSLVMRLRNILEQGLRALLAHFSRHVSGDNAKELRWTTVQTTIVGAILFSCFAATAPITLRVLLPNVIFQKSTIWLSTAAAYASLVGIPSYYFLIARKRTVATAASFLIQTLTASLAIILLFGFRLRIGPGEMLTAVALGMAASTAWLWVCAHRSMRQRLKADSKAQINVVHVIDALPDFGGTPIKLYTECAHAKRVRHSFICLVEQGAVGQRLSKAGTDVLVLRRERWNPGIILDLVLAFRRLDAQVVCCHFMRSGIWGRLSALLSGIPVVMFEHGLDRKEFFPYLQIDRLLGRFTTEIVANSLATAEHLSKVLELPREKISVSYPLVQFEPLPRRGNAGEAYRMGTVGGLNRCKGHGYLIEALAMLRSEGMNCTLEIAGEGDRRDELTSLAWDLGVDAHVSLPGYCSNVPQFLSSLDLFVFPSVSEGFGIALVEAMLAGLPVVVSDAGALPEVVQHGRNGIVVRAKDAVDLAAGIRLLATNPSLAAQLAEAGRLDARERFAQNTDTRFEQLLEGAACRH